MQHDSDALVEAQNLQKFYGPAHAVRGISFTVQRGQVVGFLGPNGAGKSTTMKMLTGFLRPTSGYAYIAGYSVEDDPLAARRMLGYLPENAPLYDDMMVLDFLRFIAELRAVPTNVRRKRIQEACERCGLTDVLGKDIGQLSKGYRQRVGLAQALLHDPDLLILDEPTSGLDPNQIIEIRELIRDLGRDKTVLLSTHILPEVQATCGRVIIINEGNLVADDRPDALSDQAAGAVIRLVVKARQGPVPTRESVTRMLVSLPSVAEVEARDGEGQGTLGFTLRDYGAQVDGEGRSPQRSDVREQIFDAAIANNLIILDLHRERVSLEDAFRRLTRGDTAANPYSAYGSRGPDGLGKRPFGHMSKTQTDSRITSVSGR